MAKLHKQVFGRVRGSLGDYTFREVRGKHIVSHRPRHNKNNVPESLKLRRAQFSVAVSLAKALGSFNLLKGLWKLKTPSGISYFNYIVQLNFKKVSSLEFPALITMAPSADFIADNPAVTITEAGITALIGSLENKVNLEEGKNYFAHLFTLLFMMNPADSTLPKNYMLAVPSAKEAFDPELPLNFNTSFGEIDALTISSYQSRKAFNLLIIVDDAGKPVFCSAPFSV